MKLRTILIFCALLASVFGRAADYELVVPKSWSGLKGYKALYLYDPSGTFKKGDRIVSIKTQGSTEGSVGVALGEGKISEDKPLVAAQGLAKGYAGRIHLIRGESPANAVKAFAVFVPPPPVQKPKARTPEWVQNAVEKGKELPWAFIAGGVLVLGAAGFLLRPKRSQSTLFYGKKGVEERLRELAEKLDDIGEKQERLVKNPPVMRTFRKQIDGYDARLKTLESELQALIKGGGEHNSDLKRILSTLETGRAEAEGRVNALESRLARLDALEVKLLEIRGKQDEQASQGSLTGLEAKLQQVESSLASQAPRLEHLERGLLGLTDLGSDMSKSLDQKLAEAFANSGVLEANIKGDLQNQASAFAQKFDELSAKYAALTEALAAGLEERFRQIEQRQEEVASKTSSELEGELRAFLDNLGEIAAREDSGEPSWAHEVRMELAKLSAQGQELAESLRLVEALVAKVQHDAQAHAESTQAQLLDLQSRPSQGHVDAYENPSAEIKFESPEVSAALEQAQPVTWTSEFEELNEILNHPYAAGEPEPGMILELQIPEPESTDVENPPFELVLQEGAHEESSVEEEIPLEEPDASHPVLALEESVQEEPAAQSEKDQAPASESDDESDDEPTNPARIWSSAGGSPRRRWSTEVTEARSLVKAEGALKPMKPIQTTDTRFPIGAMVMSDRSLLYAHGDTIRSYWPGREDRHVSLSSVVPVGDWRLLAFSGSLYCVEEHQVEVLSLTTLSRQTAIDGRFFDQTHTENYWVGLRDVAEGISLEFRTASGLVAANYDVYASAALTPMVAIKNSVFFGSRSGELFRADIESCKHLPEVSKPDETLLFLGVHRDSLVTVSDADGGLAVRLISAKGEKGKEALIEGVSPTGNPVLMGNSLYVFDSIQGEVVVFNLRKMQVDHREPAKGVRRVRRMVGIACGKQHLLAFAGGEESEQGGRLFLLDPAMGTEYSLGTTTQPHTDMLAVDGHLVLALSCSYQNTISVYAPFMASGRKADVA